ncbi:MAG: CRISPR-associated protein Cas4 [Chloroflexota bacterium]
MTIPPLPDEQDLLELQARLRRRDEEAPLMVTDLKQWIYCRRILYYLTCLPDVRPTTYLMEVGREQGKAEESRELRRTLQRYGLENARREFGVRLSSAHLGLRGVVDMVLWVDDAQPQQALPVDFKFSHAVGEHVQLQLMAYGRLLEEVSGRPSPRGFLVEIPLRRTVEVPFTPALRRRFEKELAAMQAVLRSEEMPPPAKRPAKCVVCEFRRFCNDVSGGS